jgi:hypothetical protein
LFMFAVVCCGCGIWHLCVPYECVINCLFVYTWSCKASSVLVHDNNKL